MENTVHRALWALTQNYMAVWQSHYQHLPCTDAYIGLPSPCVVSENDHQLQWQPVKRDALADFANVEQAIALRLHSDIKDFYNAFYCADLSVRYQGESISLLQVWSDDDLARLQENILGHLMMQRQRKLTPSVFIATTADEMVIIAIDNMSGEVIRETLNKGTRDVIAPNLETFLAALEVDVA
ncbi:MULTISPECIES: SecY-interacting protein [Salinivibrio]|uniref:Protein Syd n=1 Tax=Salinivibrio siamensis TaxID=414286 RepID=A0ABX3KFY5_9GAMM|nr:MULTISPECIES: SecY-interacting protein [Salinivibrio]KKA45510.1 secretion protein [Salinivibrio sp. KP-1]OOE66207.1 SecY-interacting protein [Salinivibrio sp. IB868]OOE72623.1 SecY-interacting protein [Salinivibrio sp. ML290]OOE76136.1 SecY-interacting protein [Salinivibrio sp. IB870]OOE79060.1 SecY-interacting protein [Salinivibrio sp. ML198]